MAKTAYHSELVSLSPIKITVNSGVIESTKKKGTFYVKATINGEERYINPENDGIMDFFDAHNGQTVTIVAAGRDKDATITLVGEELPRRQEPAQRPAAAPQNPPARQPAPAPAPSRQAAKPEPQRPAAEQHGDTVTNAKHFIARNRVLAVMALEAAWFTKMEFESAKKFEMPSDIFTAVFNTMLFGASANGFTASSTGLPMDMRFKIEEGK